MNPDEAAKNLMTISSMARISSLLLSQKAIGSYEVEADLTAIEGLIRRTRDALSSSEWFPETAGS